MKLSAQIKSLRKEKKISQRELAEQLNISPSTVGMYEVNQRVPDIETLKKMADYFDVSTDYLLGRTNIKHTPSATVQESPGLYQEKKASPGDIDLENIIIAAHDESGSLKITPGLKNLIKEAILEIREERRLEKEPKK